MSGFVQIMPLLILMLTAALLLLNGRMLATSWGRLCAALDLAGPGDDPRRLKGRAEHPGSQAHG
jgi:hypothetical protein